MKAGAMVESKFLKKEDLNYDTGNLVTVSRIDRQNVGLQDGEEDMKWCMYFKEFQKPMVLNSTNIQLTTKALGTDETDDWIGKKVVIYVDDNVSFGGKLVGGIRIRRPRGQVGNPAPKSKPQTQDEGMEEIRQHAARRQPPFEEQIKHETPPW
jgi:hypothetical protein